ncbi:hypothetical protein GCM10011529_27970 [Polymorphobacter glacialis]|uniref:Four-helix bundle copper-binding protein n=1 Tax=Sandarakinorhabdus glacialis TaxID=1614636 RepID=A0A916ZZ47_9SPHN|nr:four-helix bundle copper-binding protein [Polymorphobacter glacialis]GGE19789.1 hypothetical protein GCM10011529_27970 [Polymorphobacter glacialis]
MSIQKMIAAHPDVAGNVNEPLASAVRHAMFCAALCNSCADACSAETMDMRQCIRSCLDCADICAATASVGTRRTGSNIEVMRSMFETCIRTCNLCADECSQHDNDHCRLCTMMCRECAHDCQAALPTIH